MITFFNDDMQREIYTDAFLNNVNYYYSLNDMKESLYKLISTYITTSKIDYNNILEIIKDWDKYASTRNYKCLPIEEYFSINIINIKKAFETMRNKYWVPSYGNESFFVNLYNIQKNICKASVIEIRKNDLKYSNRYVDAIRVGTYDRNKYIIKLVDNNKASRYIISKFTDSLGVFDTITYKMVAYKNFKDGKTFGDWNKQLENRLIAIYNMAVGIKKCINKPVKNINKTVKNTNKDEKEKTEHIEINNKKHYSINELLARKLDRLSDFHKVDKTKIREIVQNNIDDNDIKLLEYYIEVEDLVNFESLAKKLYDNAFIILVDYQAINASNVSNEADEYYYKLTGNRVKNLVNKCVTRDREYRQHTKRGILVNSRGEIIDGGNNRTGQSQINIKMNDTDFNKLCNMFRMNNPNQSELNGIVEEVLRTKFETYNNFTLNNRAKLAVLYNRDKRQQSKISNYKSCYIPCEYNAYITEIQRRNYKTENFKNSKTFVLSVILHEYIGYI